MKRTGNHVSELRIAYIGGGSRNWAWNLMCDLALEEQLSGEVLLYDIDHAAAQANECIGNSIEQSQGKWRYRAVESLEKALCGADFVVISILPGTLDEMAVDVELPEKYGIYQSVGDTVGPAGILRAMRTLPMYHVIAEAVRDHCPNAWVINYTNPMSVCVGYLYKVWPGIKAIGCCHELFGLQKLLANLVNEAWGASAAYHDIFTNPVGVNHFTFVNKATFEGRDVFPLFAAAAEKYAETGSRLSAEGESEGEGGSYFECLNKVKFDLFRRFLLLPAGGDRHLAEFCPQWYLKTPENVERWGFALTPVSYRKKMEAERRAQSRAIVEGRQKFEVRPSGEDEVGQMKALLGLSTFVTNANMPNKGQIPSLPLGAVVETNMLFHQDAIDPMFSGSIPDALNVLMLRHVVNQGMLVDAVYEKNIGKAFEAFLNDPLVDLTKDDAKALFDGMVAGSRAYLDWWY